MKIFSIKGMFAVALINVIILNENICLYTVSVVKVYLMRILNL